MLLTLCHLFSHQLSTAAVASRANMVSVMHITVFCVCNDVCVCVCACMLSFFSLFSFYACLISLLGINMRPCLLGQGASLAAACWMLNQVNSKPSFYVVNMCLGFVMIDLDGVIKKDWLAFSEDNHDSFTTGIDWVELGNISRALLVMCHLLWYHLFLCLSQSVLLWSPFLSPCLQISLSPFSFSSDLCGFASRVPC